MDDELEYLREKRARDRLAEIEKKRSFQGVVPISEKSFSGFIAENRFAVVDFWAEWCGPCRRVAPVVEALAHEMAGLVAFAKCNTDESPAIARKFGITAIPTIILYANGTMIDRVTGAVPKETLRSVIIRAFGLPPPDAGQI
ncbi:thioredoxin 1 [Methanocalculus alkaliphilus]|uniref:thioredoxin n=1 Tax=Methanocalculus alkaliphilus TaxID=768730 RepID=UPI00209E7021|nr:thioredoxin [Methanocalculus alkaliphilus]MCP1714418.1 thioredoxin 1 [Methanocalculus alkaliphilus]